MNQQIIFNHIPKTGGTTLRIIFNKVYGEENVFFINSRNIGESLERFKNLSNYSKSKFKVISGHGADFFTKFTKHPIKISIIREPVSMFISQYYYLKQSNNSNFKNEINSLVSIDDYLDYAIKNGQNNLLTRYFSNSIDFLTNPTIQIPNLNVDGNILIEKAKQNIDNYKLIINLSHFDKGIYQLSKLLKWRHIPLYRPSNITIGKNKKDYTADFIRKIEDTLKWDIELYNYINSRNPEITNTYIQDNLAYKLFLLRQNAISRITKLIGRS